MSLFGSLGQNASTPLPSITKTSATMSSDSGGTAASLFGKPAAPAPSNQTTLLFDGAAKPATTSATSGSLFGAATTNNTGASLFGATPATNPSPAGASLFGNATATVPQGNNLFAKPAESSVTSNGASAGGLAGGSSMFGQTGNASLFGSNILPTSKPTDSEVIARDPATTIADAQPAYFQALLERGNKKRQTTGNVTPFGELPQLELGLGDISRKVRKIGQGGPSSALSTRGETQSYYVLAASGVDTTQALRDLADLSGSVRATTTRPQQEYELFSGIRDGLANYHQNNFERMIDDRIRQAHVDFDRMIDDKLHYVDWNAHRQRIHEHFGLRKPGATDDTQHESFRETGNFGRASRRGRLGASLKQSAFGLSGMSKSIIGAPGVRGTRISTFADVAEKMPEGIRPAPEDRAQRQKQEKYAGRIKDLNVARLQEKSYPLLHRFAEIEAEPSDADNSMLVNAYNALVKIIGEDATGGNLSDPAAIRQRQYAKAYQNESTDGEVRKRIIQGSRKYLESQFLGQVEASVAKNPREANVGGVPSSIALIKGYVRVRAARKELGPDMELLQDINGDYCWPVIFYLLRGGLYQETLDYLEENQAAFRQIDRSFMRYLRAFVLSDDHRLSQEMQTTITNEYSQRQRLAPEDSIDPYRMMCYKIVGRCDINRRSLDGITNDMMDWIWLQFALAREYTRNEEFAYEAFGLEELRKSVKEIGDRYFGAGSDIANAPTTLFFMQILAGMFEKAIADLYPHNYATAVHFAIALDYYGLLRVSDISNSDDLLTYTTRQEPQIAFASMIGLYTRDFRTADPTVAVDYLTLICLNDDLVGELGSSQREVCHQAITELVLETREFAQLLGDIRSDGQRIHGAVEQRLRLIGISSQQEFLKHITLVAARAAQEQSRVTDAALLYHLAEDYEKVMHIISDALSLSLTTELGSAPLRLAPLVPRKTGSDGSAAITEQNSSLSLTAVEDPIALAKNMYDLYNSSQMYSSKIKQDTWAAALVLLQLADARSALEQGRWDYAIDRVSNAGVLPIKVANGDISAIRAAANSFDSMVTVVARTIGHVMIWTVLACGKQLEHLRQQEFETGHRQAAMQQCVDTASNIMVFAGLIKLQLKDSVWATLAQAGQDLGVY